MSGMEAESAAPRPVNRLLWIAAAAGAEAAVKLHIARGDYLEWRDKRGLTPLMVAASRDRAAVCRLLLDAGVDAGALDATGRNALSIARAAGALSAADVIAACIPANSADAEFNSLAPPLLGPAEALVKQSPPEDQAMEPTAEASARMPDPVADSQAMASPTEAQFDEPPSVDAGSQSEVSRGEPSSSGHAPEVVERVHREAAASIDEAAPISDASTRSPTEAKVTLETPPHIDDEPLELTFGDWEPVAPTKAPVDVPSIAAAEGLRQRRIDAHAPVDNSADWTAFEAELPEFAKPLPRANQAEFQASLRSVLLLALREGSVPRVAIEDLLSERGDADLRDPDAEEQLLVAIGDLGAEVDERLELAVGGEAFKVFVDPAETSVEEREVDEALAFFEDLRSGRNEPLRIYMRSIGPKALLTAEREVALAKAMEAVADRALDALSSWPAGLRALIESVAGAESSPAILWSIVATAREEADPEDEPVDERVAPEPAASATEAADDAPSFAAEPTGSAADALRAFARIRQLADSPEPSPSKATKIREQLGALSFRRPYLASLGDRVSRDQGAEAAAYRLAISNLLESRDEMTRANLRLVYSNAKRYLNSGMPLDDLMQEGNIGLIKAVDRFDWRRGFRFSTMATWWIKQQITRSIADFAFDIRLPVHVHEKMWKLRATTDAFERESGRSPSPVESAAMLGINVQRLEAFMRPSSEPVSLEDAEAMGAFELDAQPDPMDVASDKEIVALISTRLSSFKRRMEAIVRMRGGIGLNEAQTLEQVGVAFGLTRERVRQIEAKTMRVLGSVRSREQLAVATGRPLPKNPEALYDLPEDVDELDGKDASAMERAQPAKAAKAAKAPGKKKEKPVVRDVEFAGDPSSPDALPSSIRRILDSARALGIEVDVQVDGPRARILVAEIPSMDRDSRKLVRDMLQMGFVREQGKGYRR